MVVLQQSSEITVASLFTEHLAESSRLMEMILERGNMFKALKRVRGNKGVPSASVRELIPPG
jgi:RNA-directed DNA polymerase